MVSKQSTAEIIIEDVELRCEEKFGNDNRCWNLAVKAIKIDGVTRKVCSAHYEEWLSDLLMAGGKIVKGD